MLDAFPTLRGVYVVLAAAGDLQLGTSGRVGARAGTAALSTDSRFTNSRGAEAISAGHWVVYAPSPAGHVFGGLDSGNTALWGTGIDSRPPSAVNGNRYVFGSSPTLTFTSLDAQKAYGDDASDDLSYSVTGFEEGVSGAFLGDSAGTAFSGTPQLTSAGAGSAATVAGSPYPIDISQGSLTSAAGYGFAFRSTGLLTVTPPDDTPPSVTLTQQPAANAAGWQRSAAIAHVVATDESGIDSLACTLDGQAVALANAASDATRRSGDIPVVAEGRHAIDCRAVDGASNVGEGNDTVKVDMAAPNAPLISADRAPEYTGGGDWYKGSVTLSFAGAGDPQLADGTEGSGVDPSAVPAAVSRTTSGALTATGAVKDNAGNASATTSKTVQVDADAPSLSVSCPDSVELNATATVTIEASDGESNLASDPSGTLALDTSAVGEKTVTRTATDNVGNSTQKSCTTKVVSTRELYTFGGFRPPINPDGSSVFKLGSTVPTKFALTDANGAPIADAVATLQIAKLTANVEGTVSEATSTAAANSGSQFRYDSAQQQYVFNLGTKSLSTGTWRLRATLDDGTSHTVQISLK